jgi:hypothetical protein
MDWGLFDKSAGENKFLREETVYSSTVSINNRYYNMSFSVTKGNKILLIPLFLRRLSKAPPSF